MNMQDIKDSINDIKAWWFTLEVVWKMGLAALIGFVAGMIV